jgi:WD40 repeat protein/energy-coupling factor transporter ATP-binding protein EcfA2
VFKRVSCTLATWKKLVNNTMKKLVVLKFDGAFESGFKVNLTISDDGKTPDLIANAELPLAPELLEISRFWRKIYRDFYGMSRIKPLNARSVNIQAQNEDLQQKSQDLIKNLNDWLNSTSFQKINNSLKNLNPQDEIRIIIATSSQELRQLPWHLWNFLQEYPLAEVALSAQDAECGKYIYREKARILVILGNSTGIDVNADKEFLKQYCNNGEIVLLQEPSRHILDEHLKDDIGWDMLFFSGHSCTDGTQGRIFLNKYDELKITELRDSMKIAISKRLQIACFNSCDGLGIASELEQLNIPQIIVMREPVPDKVAQEFLKSFLQEFTGGQSLYLSVKKARTYLFQNLNASFPYASWLPIIIQNQLETPPTWQSLGIISLCPYQGLDKFTQQDAKFFFGRTTFVHNLLIDINSKPFVAVVGASGSGKSSVVFAGLIPKLPDTWRVISFRPTEKPFESLAVALAEVNINDTTLVRRHDVSALKNIFSNSNYRDVKTLLIIDQFEEVFTLCQDSHERNLFIDALLAAINSLPQFTLLVTCRADFLGKAISYQPLGQALQKYPPSLLAPMNRLELEQAIIEPAKQYCVEFEPGLVNKLIDDVGDGEGSLPLQQFALTQLWHKQRPGKLTHAAYREIGGVKQAIAIYAEDVYRQLHAYEQKMAPCVFIQLVQPGEGTEDTRRVATKHEIGADNWGLVQKLANKRLVITNRNESKNQEETVEIVHEALIREWARLQDWIHDNREFRSWQERLRLEVKEWQNSNYDSGRLLQETPLAIASNWYSTRALELTEEQQKFIEASISKQNKQDEERRNRRRFTVSALASGLFAVSILAGLSEIRRIDAEVARLSITAEQNSAKNEQEAALLEAIKAGKKLKGIWQPWITPGTRMLTVSTLQETVYDLRVQTLKGHTDVIFGVTYSPDGKTLASASSDKTVKLWDINTGKVIQTLKGHISGVQDVNYSPDGKILASSSNDGTIKLWDVKTAKIIKNLKAHKEGAVFSVSFSPDGKKLASASADETVKLWDINTGKVIQTFTGHQSNNSEKGNQAVFGVVFSPDGKILASSSADKTIKLSDVKTGKQIKTLAGHKSQVWGISFSPDGKKLASASWDSTIKLWDIATGKEILPIVGHEDSLFGVSFSPDGKMLASSSSAKDTTVKLWDVEIGLELKTFKGHTDSILDISFSPDGKTIASASADRTIKLWNVNTRYDIKRFQDEASQIISATLSPDSKLLAFATADNIIQLWDIKTSSVVKRFKGHTDLVINLSFSPDSKKLASASFDKTVKLWDIAAGKKLQTFEGHTEAVFGANFSSDGKQLASASEDETIKLWDTQTGKELKTLKGHTSKVINVSFSPDNKTLASASSDNTIKIWDINTAKDIQTLKGHTSHVWSATFSPDGNILASTSRDRTLKLWNLHTGKEIKTLKGHTNLVYGASFSPDSQTLASASGDETIKLWDVNTGSEIKTLKQHQGAVINVRFSTNGQSLSSVSKDNTVISWNLNLDDLLARGCLLIKDYLQNDPDVAPEDKRSVLNHLCNPHVVETRGTSRLYYIWG